MKEKSLAFSVPQMAEALGISKPVAYELIKKEGFPAVRISDKRIIVPVKMLERWLDEQVELVRK